MPAEQGFEADHLAIDLRQRLVVKTELVALQGAGEFVLERAPLTQPVIHFDFEETRLAATVALGTVKGGIGIVEERRGVATVGRKDRNSDA